MAGCHIQQEKSRSKSFFLFLFARHCVIAVQLLSQVWIFATPETAAHQAPLSFSPSIYSNSCPFSQWCYLTILSSVTLFSFCLQRFPSLRSFLMSWLFILGYQSIGASASVLPMNIQDWFPLGLTGLISLMPKGLSRVFSNTTIQKHRFLRCSVFFMVYLSHPYMTTEKTIALTRQTVFGKVMSLI